MQKHIPLLTFMLLFCGKVNTLILAQTAVLEETFKPLPKGFIPETTDELWQDYDARKEPLEVELLHEWEEDEVIMKVIRYRIGVFKGKKAFMAAIYGYPKGAKKIPGLLQIHGGGQFADYRTVLMNAKRGYATISVAWAGRINAPDYRVDAKGVKLFWEGETENLNYKITTDWGTVDAYHAPTRSTNSIFHSIPKPSKWTLDPVLSPRNDAWFLVTVGTRRALTFLENQVEVDAEKLGIYGHSMGGKLTVLTTGADDRVKAAVPSCGGISDRYNEMLLYQTTLGDDNYLKKIDCPILFLIPSNDFHGRITDLRKAFNEVKSKEKRVSCSAHQNHKDNPEFMAAGLLWFDQHLKQDYALPEMPQSELILKTKTGIPVFNFIPDTSKEIISVDVFYTQDINIEREIKERKFAINRFWQHARATKKNEKYTTELPLITNEKSLSVYANVLYKVEKTVAGAGYYARIYETNKVNLSTLMHSVSPEELNENEVVTTFKPTTIIEDFKEDWQKTWFTNKPDSWEVKTRKVCNDLYKAPANASLSLELKSMQANELVIGIDKYAAIVKLKGGEKAQAVLLSPSDFIAANGKSLIDFSDIKELRFSQMEVLKGRDRNKNRVKVGKKWVGAHPEFKNLRWVTK